MTNEGKPPNLFLAFAEWAGGRILDVFKRHKQETFIRYLTPEEIAAKQAMTIILDPGHGMSNRRSGKYDPGAVAGGYTEAEIALAWANELRTILRAAGHRVIRTRVDEQDPCPVWRRDDIARSYKGDRMLSLHCNSGGGKPSGTETFFRGEDDRELAIKLTDVVCRVLGTKNRGAKTEKESQHESLAVMEFDKCWLLEIGFIDNEEDRRKMTDPALRLAACQELAKVIA